MPILLKCRPTFELNGAARKKMSNFIHDKYPKILFFPLQPVLRTDRDILIGELVGV